MWVSPTSDKQQKFDVLYIGKAGFGVARRLQQHKGGFVNSRTGRKNREAIADWIAQGRSIEVFARVASMSELFGVPVSLYSAEEEALCGAFEPQWNRAVFPAARTTSDAPKVVEGADVACLAHGDEIAAFFDSLPGDRRALFLRLANLVVQRFPGRSQKLVKGYANQPTGYNNTPMLVFADVGPSGRALNNRWVARIPLVVEGDAALTILFPASAKSRGLDPRLIAEGNHGAWRPRELAAFLDHPDEYLT
jgi:hypothetical protein